MKRIALGCTLAVLAATSGGCMIGRGKNKGGAYAVNGLIMGTGLILAASGDDFGAAMGTTMLITGGIGLAATGASSSDEVSSAPPLDEAADPYDRPIASRRTSARPTTSRGCAAWVDAVNAATSEGTRATLNRHMPPECRGFLTHRPMPASEPVRIPPTVSVPETAPATTTTPTTPTTPPTASTPTSSKEPAPAARPRTLSGAECDRRWAEVDSETDLSRRDALEAAMPPECR